MYFQIKLFISVSSLSLSLSLRLCFKEQQGYYKNSYTLEKRVYCFCETASGEPIISEVTFITDH
jgi:hypothetical protein